MKVCRTPVRISFFGGGTDYPDYFKDNKAAVLGMSIDKFVYISALPLAGMAEQRYRVTYRQTESVDDVAEIQHPVIRSVLEEYGFDAPLNIATMSDYPGGTGLGSSSAFTVGFINIIQHLLGRTPTKYELAREAIRIEQDVLKENVGVQDQIHAAFGGLNLYRMHATDFSIQPVRLSAAVRDSLNTSMLLVYTGADRHAHAVLEEQVANTRARKISSELSHLVALAEDGVRVLEQASPDEVLRDVGTMLSDAWKTKRGLSSTLSNDRIDEVFNAGISLGAFGGKLCGAGGGGFFLFLASPDTHPRFIESFGAAGVSRIALSEGGSSIASF